MPGIEIIVPGEHVDYWDRIGWKDRYSSPIFGRRQRDFARRFGLDSVYTAQMVVDGVAEFGGSDSAAAEQSIAQ